jgi:ABC-type uncharacterized transport system permease subunit
MIRRVQHNFRVLLACWRLDFKAAAHFRWDALLGVLVSITWMFFAIAPVLVAGQYLGGTTGWTGARLLFLSAIWYWMDAVMWVFAEAGIRQLTTDVRQGRLDGKLLQPCSSLVRCMLGGSMNIPDIPKFAIAIALGTWAITHGALPGGPMSLLGFVVALLAASVILWVVAVLSIYKVITLMEFDGRSAMYAVHNLSRVPTDLYAPGLRLILSSVFPVVLITTVPAHVFFGWGSWWLPLISVAVASVAVAVLRLAWRREIRDYAGLQG